MGYYTHYQFHNKANGEILFRNDDHSCFRDWTYETFDDKTRGFGPGRVMTIASPRASLRTALSFEDRVALCHRFVDGINQALGYTIRFEVKSFEISCRINLKWEYVAKECLTFELDCDEFQSKHEIKLIAYLIRYLYEENAYRYVVEMFEKAEPNGYVTAWLNVAMNASWMYAHDFQYGRFFLYTRESIKEYDLTQNYDTAFLDWFNQIKQQPYDDNNTTEQLADFIIKTCTRKPKPKVEPAPAIVVQKEPVFNKYIKEDANNKNLRRRKRKELCQLAWLPTY